MSHAGAVFLLLLGWLLLPASAAAYSEERAGFTVRVRDDVCSYRVLGVYVLPGESVPIEVVGPEPGEEFALTAAPGKVRRTGHARWTWEAPEAAGLYPVRVERRDPAEAMLLNVFVMVPFDRLEHGHLGRFRVGAYPDRPYRDLEAYDPPRGFVEVRPENESVLLSPHFRLGQFVCKQPGGYPRYVVLRERLLLKLEHLLKAVNDQVMPCEGFCVMSGYRTPHYNAGIGNVQYSRHQWGDGADIFIDESPRDGVMDDLNSDGRIDARDSAFLYDLIESLSAGQGYEPFTGGLGRYGNAPNHGPFVHIDVRGYRARWGR